MSPANASSGVNEFQSRGTNDHSKDGRTVPAPLLATNRFRAAQTIEERLAALLELRRSIDAEIRRVREQVPKKRRTRRSPRVIPECGTESAYQRHRWYGEERDEACKAAHYEHNRQQLQAIREAGAA